MQVKIEGRPDLLNKSRMICTRQGVIEIILNEQTAIKAAEYISSCNNKAFWWQVGSQALQGVFTGMAAGATGPVRLIEMGINVGIVSSMTSVNATRNAAQSSKETMNGYQSMMKTAKMLQTFENSCNLTLDF